MARAMVRIVMGEAAVRSAPGRMSGHEFRRWKSEEDEEQRGKAKATDKRETQNGSSVEMNGYRCTAEFDSRLGPGVALRGAKLSS